MVVHLSNLADKPLRYLSPFAYISTSVLGAFIVVYLSNLAGDLGHFFSVPSTSYLSPVIVFAPFIPVFRIGVMPILLGLCGYCHQGFFDDHVSFCNNHKACQYSSRHGDVIHFVSLCPGPHVGRLQ